MELGTALLIGFIIIIILIWIFGGMAEAAKINNGTTTSAPAPLKRKDK